jgi:hypothetical protein
MPISRRAKYIFATTETHKTMYIYLQIYPIIIAAVAQYSGWLRAGRLRCRSSSPGRVKNFRFVHIVQSAAGAYQVSYQNGYRGLFPWR